MKLVEECVSECTLSDARGMGGVKIGGGTKGRVQLNVVGCIGGGGGTVCDWGRCGAWNSGCMVGGDIRNERSWSMGGLVGSP